MKTVEVYELPRWGFKCPDCNSWNELDDYNDPNHEDTIHCYYCWKTFKPNVVTNTKHT